MQKTQGSVFFPGNDVPSTHVGMWPAAHNQWRQYRILSTGCPQQRGLDLCTCALVSEHQSHMIASMHSIHPIGPNFHSLIEIKGNDVYFTNTCTTWLCNTVLPYKIRYWIPGHKRTLQSSVWLSVATLSSHGLPPNCGPSHALLRDRVAAAHVAEQADHCDHSDHSPSTKRYSTMGFYELVL